MIRRFQLIRNCGRFGSYAAQGNEDLAPYSLIYAENGFGKTTLCAILRSLSTGEPEHIIERTRFGSQHPPYLVIELGDGLGTSVFENSQWSILFPDILIFDEHFVNENVYSGLEVDAAHRQNIHGVIIGRQGVALVRRIEELNVEIASHHGSAKTIEDRINSMTLNIIDADTFCSLPPVEDIEEKMSSMEKRIAALSESSSVLSTPLFDPIVFPDISIQEIQDTLSKVLPDLEADAYAAVSEHFKQVGVGAEEWISNGLTYIPDESSLESATCPFCAQGLGDSSIIEHYRTYFGEAYRSHKESIRAHLVQLDTALGSEASRELRVQIDNVRERTRFWERFVETPGVPLDVDEVVVVWE